LPYWSVCRPSLACNLRPAPEQSGLNQSLSEIGLVVVWRRLRVRRVPRLRPDPWDPMHLSVAPPAGEQDAAKFSLKFRLRLKQFHSQAIRRSH